MQVTVCALRGLRERGCQRMRSPAMSRRGSCPAARALQAFSASCVGKQPWKGPGSARCPSCTSQSRLRPWSRSDCLPLVIRLGNIVPNSGRLLATGEPDGALLTAASERCLIQHLCTEKERTTTVWNSTEINAQSQQYCDKQW